MNKFTDIVAGVGLCAIVFGTILCVCLYRFHIYQKKYGEQMTYADYLFDSGK